MATYPIDAYALRKKLIDKYGLRLDLDGQEVLKGAIAEIRSMPALKGYHNSQHKRPSTPARWKMGVD